MTRIGQMIFDDGVVRGREEGREEGMIGGTIKTCKKFKLSREEATKNIIEEFSLSNEEAEKCIGSMWHMVIEEPGGMTSGFFYCASRALM